MELEGADAIQLFHSKKRKRKRAPEEIKSKKDKLAANRDAGDGQEARQQGVQSPKAAEQQQQQQVQQQQQHQEELPLPPPAPERAQGEASTSGMHHEDNEDATFKDLGLTDWLCSVLGTLGIARPTQVQRGCIPAVLAGRDVIGTAQTGSGKTAAFALPILQLLARDPYGVFALVLTPTRCVYFWGHGGCRDWAVLCFRRATPAAVAAAAALQMAALTPSDSCSSCPSYLPTQTHIQCSELAVQLAEQFRAFGAGMSLRVRLAPHPRKRRRLSPLPPAGLCLLHCPPVDREPSVMRGAADSSINQTIKHLHHHHQDCVVIGGVEQQAQAKQLARRPHVVVATPGRLAELIDNDPGLKKGFARTRCVLGRGEREKESAAARTPAHRFA